MIEDLQSKIVALEAEKNRLEKLLSILKNPKADAFLVYLKDNQLLQDPITGKEIDYTAALHCVAAYLAFTKQSPREG